LFEQFYGLCVGESEVLFQYAFEGAFDWVKEVGAAAGAQVGEAVHHALPDWPFFQYQQVFSQDEGLVVAAAVHQLPEEVETDFVQVALQLLFLALVEDVQ
jgi:hypothetical protein